MRRPSVAIALTLVALLVVACGPAATSPAPASAPVVSPAASSPSPAIDPEPIGRAFVEALAAGDTATAEAMEDAAMRAAAPADALAQLWSQVEAQFGAFEGIGEIATEPAGEFVNATVEGRFANATVPLIVTVSAAGEVAGLHLGEPVPVGDGASPSASIDPSAFTETEVTVGSEPWALPGTLSMPAGDGPFPAVVLVAGSGPADRDSTIGPNKPLKDLAQGLASNGIAALRYDKRTRVYGSQLAAQADTITVQEETVDDAVAAVELLRETPGIDPDRVVVAGHSLGGYLAPRIAAQAPGSVAAIALLEGGISPLQDLIEVQLRYLASEEGGADPQAQALLDDLPAKLALVESEDLSPDTPAADLPLGIPAAYWLDLRDYDPGAVARDLPIPILLVQGGRDYQVPPSELAAWREALAGRDDVTVSEHPAVNHILLAGEGPSRPAEYAVPGHVDAGVVSALVDWVAGL